MSFSWGFEIEDKLTAHAERMEKSLSKLETTSKKLETAMGGLDKGAKGLGESFGGFALELNAVVDIGLKAIGVLEKIGHAAFEAGKWFAEAAVESASFKETTLLSLETVLGSGEAAQRVFRNTVDLAAKLPITTGEALGYAQSFAMAGFKEAEISRLVLAASDVGALNPERKAFSQEMFVRQLREIQSVGLNSRHLMALSNETGIREDVILGKLQAMGYGEKGSSAEEMKRVLHTVNRQDAFNAILSSLTGLEGGQLGGLSGKLAGTVSGLMSTLKSRKLELFMDLNDSPAYESFRGFLSNIVTMTEPGSPIAKRLKAAISKTFDAAFGTTFGDLSGPDGLEKMEKAFEKVLGVVDKLVAGVKIGFAFVGGFIGGLFGDLDDEMSGPLDEKKIKAIADSFAEFGKGFGKDVKTIVEDLDKLVRLLERAGEYFGTYKGGHSVVKEMVRSLPVGGGILGSIWDRFDGAEGAAAVNAVDKKATTPFARAALPGMSSLGGDKLTVHVGGITVNGGKSDEETARIVKDAAVEAMASHWEQMALEGGY